MELLSESYRELNSNLHVAEPDFGINGHVMAEFVAQVSTKLRASTVLDYGCGKGTFKPALLQLAPNLVCSEYDPAIPAKAALPEPAHIVLCGDVMEHIEPAYLDNVLAHLRSLTLKLLIAGVATHPANKTLADGRNAHLIVESKGWWLNKFAAHFRNSQVADTEGGFTGLFVP